MTPTACLSQTPCTILRGVGPQLAARLQKLAIYSIQDLLFHLPSRYQDRTHITTINQLRPNDHVVVEGRVLSAEIRMGRRPTLLCKLTDDTGVISLRFFHFTKTQRDGLMRPELRVRCFGEVRWGVAGFEMIHPEYHFASPDMPTPTAESLTPIYPTTEGIQQNSFRKLTEQALQLLDCSRSLVEHLPDIILKQFSLSSLSSAVQYVHRPPPDASTVQLEAGLHPAQRRLAFEELLAHQLSLQQLRASLQSNKAPALLAATPLIEQFLATLPFALTAAQQRVSAEISMDLQCPKPMLRLVQGDVGSGKTIVAALAVLQAVASGYQAAVMAPTELLAEQHFKNFRQWCEPLGLKVIFLVSGLKASARKQALAMIANGEANIVIGTHALFQKGVDFSKLALVVIDEQHRFGVQQRLDLREKGRLANIFPHQLIMTATPIPRTLAMTAYADLDCSIIDELPPGRVPVSTALVSNARRDEVIQHISKACQTGQQAYWVCTLIEESEVLQCQAAEVTAAFLTASLPKLRIGLIHGRLKSQEKEQIMAAFKAREIDLLVATTVIEVGVDVPNASLMVIENAERLGLAQLHQLRGRVGRGAAASHCVLLYQNPLSVLAKQRLQVMRNSNDGFEIAQQDLEIRGPGEVLGTRQTGLLQLRIADLLRDKALLPSVQQACQLVLKEYPESAKPLIDRWIPKGGIYGGV